MQNEASYDLAGKRLFIGLPAYDFKVGVKLAIALAEFCVRAQQHGIQIQISNVSGCSVVSRVRNIIADQFLESDCEHLIMIDSDMTFKADDIFRLLAWNQTKPIVAGIGAARKSDKVFFSMICAWLVATKRRRLSVVVKEIFIAVVPFYKFHT